MPRFGQLGEHLQLLRLHEWRRDLEVASAAKLHLAEAGFWLEGYQYLAQNCIRKDKMVCDCTVED
jgi:hypothetical protein